MEKQFKVFKNKKILITGHTGFKGSWLAFVLHQFGAKVYGYSLKPNRNISNFEILNLSKHINNFFLILEMKKN